MLVLFSLSARLRGTFRASDGFVLFSSFGFDAGGSYNATFTDFDSNIEYCFALVPSAEARSAGPSIDCESYPYFHIVGNGTDFVDGEVDVPGVYHPYVGIDSAQTMSFTIDSCFWNPGSRLDSRWGGIIPAKVAIVLVHFTLVICWLVNWGFHFSVQIWIHYFLTAVFTATLLYESTTAFKFSYDRAHEDDSYVYIISGIFGILAEGLFFGTIVLIAKGWCIVRDSLPLRDILRAMVYPFIVILVTWVMDLVENAVLFGVLLIVAIVAVVLLIRELLLSTKDAFLYIVAHLLAIADEGINARSTPIWQKYMLYRRFQFAMLAAAIELLLYLIIDIAVTLEFLAGEITWDVIVLTVLGMLAFIFRLRGKANADYLRIGDGEDPGAEVQLADLEGLAVNGERLYGGRDWEEGMPLPRQPEIVRQQAANVVIASPDGTSTVEAGVGSV
jgi:hypothetical protein